MYKAKRYIAIVVMMCATLLMVATSTLRHHHHDDGAICLILDWGHDNESEHNHPHNSCNDDCAMNVELQQDASQIGYASKAGLTPQLIAVIGGDNSLVPNPTLSESRLIFFYIEHRYYGIVVEQHMLRAPPSIA